MSDIPVPGAGHTGHTGYTGAVPVAVVGLAALMPGARNTAEYWHNIVTGRDLITEVPPGRWPAEEFYHPDPTTPDTTYSRRGAFLPEIEFDPLAFVDEQGHDEIIGGQCRLGYQRTDGGRLP